MKYIVILVLFGSLTSYGQETVPLPKTSEQPVEIVEDEIFQIVETQPEFPGGSNKLMQFISYNFRYPEIDTKNGIQGRVYVSFVVEKDGTVSTVEILKSVSKTIDAEAIRVVKLMPNWTPGTQNGNPVRVSFHLPIIAKLKEE